MTDDGAVPTRGDAAAPVRRRRLTGRRGRGGWSRRGLLALFVAALALAWPWLPEFTVTLLNYIGLYALVALGLVMLTGVAGMTSFGQAAFVGIGAYATAWLCTSPVAAAALGRRRAGAAALARPGCSAWRSPSPWPGRSARSRSGCRATTCRWAPSPGG